MKFSDIKLMLMDSGDYCGDIERGQFGDFIGFVYARNYKYDSEELQRDFPVPIQAEEDI